MSDPPSRGGFSDLNKDVDLWKMREENERLRKQMADRGSVSHGPGNGSNANWAAKAVFQIVVGLFLVMLAAIVGVMWTRQDRFDATQQLRGERVRALELQVDELQRGRSENKARIDYLYQRLYDIPSTLPHEQPRRGGR